MKYGKNFTPLPFIHTYPSWEPHTQPNPMPRLLSPNNRGTGHWDNNSRLKRESEPYHGTCRHAETAEIPHPEGSCPLSYLL